MNKPSRPLRPGDVVVLKAVRDYASGVFLDAGTGNTADDILLHQAQQTAPVAVGTDVKVYLYRDPRGRLTASMKLPQMQEGQIARVKVINVTRDGGFVDIGAERGVFLPFSQMRGQVQVNDKIWVKLYRDKSDRPAVSMDVDQELQQAAQPAQDLHVGDQITGSIYNLTSQGAFLFTDERYLAFIHNSEMTRQLKCGEELTARITFIRDDGRLNLSMRPVKESAIDIDAAAILAALESRGRMPYSDATSPEIIKAKFGISKASFKRALGKLLKDGLIEQKDGWTYRLAADSAVSDAQVDEC